MHDAPGGDGDLIPAGLALEQLPGRFPVRFSPSAARADKPLGPARINQVSEARFVRIKAALEIENGAWEVGARHLSPVLNHPVTTLPLGVMGVNPIRRPRRSGCATGRRPAAPWFSIRNWGGTS